MTRTLYRAGWIVAFQEGEHRVLRDGCLVVEDDRITHVGSTYAEPVDRYVDPPDVIVTPSGVQEAGERVWSRWADGDWSGRSLDEVVPQTYADFTD